MMMAITVLITQSHSPMVQLQLVSNNSHPIKLLTVTLPLQFQVMITAANSSKALN